MEKTTRDRLIDASLDLLARQGSGAVTARAVEAAAGATHGTVRHHFGDLAGLRTALVAALVDAEAAPAADAARRDPSPMIEGLVTHWTGQGAPIAVARYEVLLEATRDPAVRDAVVAARDRLVDQLAGLGVDRGQAATLVAMLDGIVLDALVRGTPADLTAWHQALLHARGRS
ncbi:MAG: TetR family transcriptional regulator [Propionicimonas sp.]